MINDKLLLKGKVKKIVDDMGVLVTTDPVNPFDDDFVELDLTIPATGNFGTLIVFSDVKKGNGKFTADLSGSSVFTGAVSGDAVRRRCSLVGELGEALGGDRRPPCVSAEPLQPAPLAAALLTAAGRRIPTLRPRLQRPPRPSDTMEEPGALRDQLRERRRAA